MRARHALEPDRDVAEPDRAVARIEERPRDDPDGVREVDDPGAVGRELARPVGDREDNGNRAQRLRQAARAGRLLADAAARERDRLVGEPRLLAADADLDEDEVGAVEGAVEVARERRARPRTRRASSIRPASPPTTSSRSGSMSCSTSSVTSSRSRSPASPETSSGV